MVDKSEGSTSSAPNVYALDASDPNARLVDRTGHSAEEIRHIGELMAALAQLREAEQRLSEASQRYMKLGPTDMKALHFLIVAQNTGTIATPGAIAVHLEISTASTTKLLDRLEAAGHIVRSPHPYDRRALAISITHETYEAAVETVGRQQAKRFHAAARLTREERDVVIRFLKDMAHEITVHEGQWDPPEP
ncbi:MarR family winged helix-turn-helix transcriptional regulator [Enteractinococcus coprophilus]|uniref:MarR family transcriptional regulator n=1 Tax=Enteractinococcus coprophilus TaxID=1027633 RepID=A0A543AFB9_9MICC|nr:MarR family transcriptional regulator [Enteractinococcus coprophilus]TQL71269.1 MarR family transcriptional regulator [Enteractinococcus coprophilus]